MLETLARPHHTRVGLVIDYESSDVHCGPVRTGRRSTAHRHGGPRSRIDGPGAWDGPHSMTAT